VSQRDITRRLEEGALHPLRETARFRSWQRLGSGGMGVVYRAHDLERDTPVALKVLRRVDPVGVLQFKHEFRALADVNHPNLVRFYELIGEGEQWFFTMELVEGVDFLAHVRGTSTPSRVPTPTRGTGTPTHPTPDDPTVTHAPSARPPAGDTTRSAQLEPAHKPAGADTEPAARDTRGAAAGAAPLVGADQIARLRDALRQLATGLFALHAAGQLHRDVKPSNVMVTATGRVVILDFGIAAELTPEGVLPEADRRVVGTPAYMAPEQAAGPRVDEAADWYGVGVILYEALTGQRPYPGNGMGAVIAKQLRDPPDPRRRAPAAPEDLLALALELLARDPSQRPSGAAVVSRLGDRVPVAATLTPHPIASRAADAAKARGAILAALRNAWASAQQGASRTVLVAAGANRAASAPIGEFLVDLQGRADTVVLSGRCYERESMPYKALDSVMDAVTRRLGELGEREVWRTVPRHVHALAQLFPQLERIEAVAVAPTLDSGAGDAGDALGELLGRLAAAGTVILHIDDTHFGDAASAFLLAAALAHPAATRILVIACYRGEPDESAFVKALRGSCPGVLELAAADVDAGRSD
jgi:hypothetical protein